MLVRRIARMWDMDDLHGGGMGYSSHGGGASMHGGSSTHGGSARGGSGAFFASGTGSAPLKSMRLGKRGSLAAMIGGTVDPLDKVMVMKSVGSVAPEKALSAYYGKLSSFATVHHPYFTSGCYVLTAKANCFAIVQVSIW